MTARSNSEAPVSDAEPVWRIEVDLVEEAGAWSEVGDVAVAVMSAADAVAGRRGLLDGDAAVCIALASDAEVSKLNGEFRGKDKATNVLSFPAGESADDGFLGDIILAQETVWREALEQETPRVHHIQHLVVHGILHLLGFDHMTPEEAEEMEALEIEILAQLGIQNPYTGELDGDR